MRLYLFFFFQAEDGIRALYVTGVQTCALPISLLSIKGGFSSVQDVEETFEKELRARGGEVTVVRADSLSEEQAFVHALRLLSQSPPPDAIVAAVDRQALGVL